MNPIGLERIGWRYYIVFCCLLVAFLAITYFVFPETRGYSLEEIEVVFDGPGDEHERAEKEQETKTRRRSLAKSCHEERFEVRSA